MQQRGIWATHVDLNVSRLDEITMIPVRAAAGDLQIRVVRPPGVVVHTDARLNLNVGRY